MQLALSQRWHENTTEKRQKTRLQNHLCSCKPPLKKLKPDKVIQWDSILLCFTLMSKSSKPRFEWVISNGVNFSLKEIFPASMSPQTVLYQVVCSDWQVVCKPCYKFQLHYKLWEAEQFAFSFFIIFYFKGMKGMFSQGKTSRNMQNTSMLFIEIMWEYWSC